MNREIFRDNSIGLLILAGGKSERMGSDKAGLVLGDLTFRRHWQRTWASTVSGSFLLQKVLLPVDFHL